MQNGVFDAADVKVYAGGEFAAVIDRRYRIGIKNKTWRNPHLTLTLSPPIEWERRGNSRGRRNVARKFSGQRLVWVSGIKIRIKIKIRIACGAHPVAFGVLAA
jgi:hypothetical protein